MNSLFVTFWVVVSSLLAVVNEVTIAGTRDVFDDSLLVVPGGDVSLVNMISGFADDTVLVDTVVVFVIEIVVDDDVLDTTETTGLSSQLQRLNRRKRVVT